MSRARTRIDTMGMNLLRDRNRLSSTVPPSSLPVRIAAAILAMIALGAILHSTQQLPGPALAAISCHSFDGAAGGTAVDWWIIHTSPYPGTLTPYVRLCVK